MLFAVPVTVVFAAATALLGVSATHNSTVGLRQATKEEVSPSVPMRQIPY